MKTYDVIEYLTEPELNSIKSQLKNAGIVFVVKQHGGASKRESFYYKVAVEEKDLEEALKIARRIKVRQVSKKVRCPKCDSAVYKKVTNLNWFMRLLYFGTTPVRCKKCRTMYGI